MSNASSFSVIASDPSPPLTEHANGHGSASNNRSSTYSYHPSFYQSLHLTAERIALDELWSDFQSFLRHSRTVDLGIAFVLGRSFNHFIKSLVNDILVGPIGLLVVGEGLINRFWVLKPGRTLQQQIQHASASKKRKWVYRSLEAAQADGAITVNYGRFLQSLLNFVCVGVSLYTFYQLWGRLFRAHLKRNNQNTDAGEKKDQETSMSATTVSSGDHEDHSQQPIDETAPHRDHFPVH